MNLKRRGGCLSSNANLRCMSISLTWYSVWAPLSILFSCSTPPEMKEHYESNCHNTFTSYVWIQWRSFFTFILIPLASSTSCWDFSARLVIILYSLVWFSKLIVIHSKILFILTPLGPQKKTIEISRIKPCKQHCLTLSLTNSGLLFLYK